MLTEGYPGPGAYWGAHMNYDEGKGLHEKGAVQRCWYLLRETLSVSHCVIRQSFTTYFSASSAKNQVEAAKSSVSSTPPRGKGFFSQSTFIADSLSVFMQSPCTITCINICVHIKNPKHQWRITLTYKSSTAPTGTSGTNGSTAPTGTSVRMVALHPLVLAYEWAALHPLVLAYEW